MDRFGATDAWLMFLLWASVNGHIGASLVALVVLALYAFAAFTPAAPSPQVQGDGGKGTDHG